ncbi:N-acyl-D-amino-acid deacylase family protein [Cellulomonas denverensis]|uniref:D-aminoacylase n=1 Tax=Cellulomonas denverensis TaxID=264297 RepID=A0A7X6QYX7_9CELL|nr:D-aminoacylase [Cellulomonas denverensis]NKY22644.1 D-aminoacylase [Cellulomonas denverensis]GIG24708.1 aminoacylase [Cellulomonas denverensis]
MNLLVRGGQVLDGTGAAAVRADVLIAGDRVAAVGTGLDVPAGTRVIDAGGLLVTPGFIDPHTHSDVVPFMAEPQPFKLLQGVTTEVVGNCGNSAAPLVDDRAVELHRPISSTVAAGVDAVWNQPRSFAGYLDAVEQHGPTTHVASLVGHHTLRISANGMEQELAPGALDRMTELADRAFAEGAFGLSTGLIYAPGVYADTDEVAALAAVAARWGRPYATHMRDEGDGLADALAETLEVARRTGVRVQVSHCKAAGRANHGRSAELLATLHEARSRGIEVLGDAYPYTTGESFLTALLPAAAQVGGRDALVERLSTPEGRRALAERGAAGGPGSGSWSQTSPDGVYVSMHRDTRLLGRSLAELGGDPWDTLCDLIVADPGAMMVYRLMAEDDVRAILADPLIAIGSDNSVPVGNAHQRGWGCFPTVLGRYVRELGVLDWPEAIRKMTSLPARALGLPGRGYLAPGAVADLAVIDPATVGHDGTVQQPWRRPTGVRWTVLAGTPVVADGEFTGERAGRVLRAGRAG